MLLEGALFVGGVVGTFVLGAPAVAAMAAPHRWRSAAARDVSPSRDRSAQKAAFTPLDLGPDPVKWPSEQARERPDRSLRTPQWPSQLWDDEHFGSHWRDGRSVEAEDHGFYAMASRHYSGEESTAQAATEAAARSTRPERVQQASPPPARSRQRADAQRARQQRSAANQDAIRRQQQVALQQAQRQATQAEAPTPKRAPRQRQVPAAPPSAAPQLEAPSREELEALIAKVGLAGTVQAIMDRTGWDFRQAAHYLAKIRQGR